MIAKKSKVISTCFFLLFFLVFHLSAEIIAIKVGKLVDPERGSSLKNALILIEGKKIIETGIELKIPDGARVIDLTHMAVLPGLIDCHTHLCNTFQAKGDVGAELLLYSMTVSTADRALQGVANARSMLESGFTVVRDMGNAGNFADVALKKAIERGDVLGPKIFVSGKIIAPFGGQFFLGPEYPDIGRHDYFYADTRDELLRAIRQNIHFGADWIKIVVDDYPYLYSAEDIRFMVEEAAKAGHKVAAHCVTERGARNAAEAGLASIEHGFEMSDNTLEIAKKNGVFLVATDLTQELMDLYNFFTATETQIIDRLKRAFHVGVQVAFGSDIIVEVPGHTRGSASLSLLDTWVKAEIPPQEILRALTVNGAKLLGIEKERGGIRKGMIADLIATSEDPIEDIMTLKDVKFVMKEGVVVKSSPFCKNR